MRPSRSFLATIGLGLGRARDLARQAVRRRPHGVRPLPGGGHPRGALRGLGSRARARADAVGALPACRRDPDRCGDRPRPVGGRAGRGRRRRSRLVSSAGPSRADHGLRCERHARSPPAAGGLAFEPRRRRRPAACVCWTTSSPSSRSASPISPSARCCSTSSAVTRPSTRGSSPSAGEVGLGATLALLAIGHPWNVVRARPGRDRGPAGAACD